MNNKRADGRKTDDTTAENLQKANALGFFDARHDLNTDRFNEELDIRLNPFFKKTVHTIESTIQGEDADWPCQIPLIYPNDYQEDPTATEANYDVSPRLLYFAGYRGLPQDSKVVYAFTGGVAIGQPLSFMTNYNYSADFNLSFANEVVEGTAVTGLFEAFYLQEYARKRIGKRLECRYFWDLLQISALSFRNKMLLSGRLWLLQKIDGFNAVSDNSTKTILVLDEPPSDEDSTAVSVSGIVGIVNVV